MITATSLCRADGKFWCIYGGEIGDELTGYRAANPERLVRKFTQLLTETYLSGSPSCIGSSEE
jgi:hypothetical protein